MAQKSILEEALLQIENLEEAMKQNTKGILSSTMKENLRGLLESEKEEEEGSDVVEQPDAEEDSDVDEQPDVEEDVPTDNDDSVDDDDEEEEEDTDDDVSLDDTEMPSDDDTEMPSDDDTDTLDMTQAPHHEVLKVFKAMKPEDGIIVKKDGNNLEVDFSGDEYIIKLDELDEDEPTSVNKDMSEYDMSDTDMSMEEESEDTGDETVYEIELDEESDEINEPEEEMKETKQKKTDKKVEATEAARTKWNQHGNKGGAKRAPLPKKVFKAGSESKVVNEEFKKLKKQNDEYKKALVLFKEKLNEVAVFNANLAYATRLFTEQSTTKQEKLSILKRFDSVSSMNESKKLYSVIKTELENKKPVTETVVEKITSTSKSSSSKNVLAESKAYENPQFKRMKDLMNKLK